jgi:UDP-glucose 4-epimerase
MKVLVTGGAGFIGSHIAEALCRRGANVVVLDNLSGGSLDNLAWRRNGDALEFIRGDIRDRELVRKVIAGCDWVFHQAAIASVPYSVREPEETNAVNLDATLGLLTESERAGVKKFVFASSCSVLGDLARPAREDDAIQPLSPYALQKYGAERYARLFSGLRGLPAVALRYFNVFGPRQSANSPYSGVIARFCAAALSGQRPVIYGDGMQTRDFVFVEDVVRANLLAAERNEAAGEVFHVGSGRSTSLLDLVRALNAVTGQNLIPDFQPARAGDIRFSRADITKAQNLLGYAPEVSLEEGLRRTVQFYRSIASPSQ